jgi:hypothetical protein
MKSEFLKLKKNIFFWIVLLVIFCFGLRTSFLNQTIPNHFIAKPIIFNQVSSLDNYFVALTNTMFGYYFLLFFSIFTLIIFQSDNALFKKIYIYNFNRSHLSILFNKTAAVFIICLILYSSFIIFSLYNLGLTQQDKFAKVYLFVFAYFLKYIVNSFLLIVSLILLQALLKNIWLYILFIAINISTIFFIDQQYSLFSWYVNALAVLNKFSRNKSFDLTHSYQSELFLLITFLIFLFSYLYYEKVNYRKVRP